MSNEHFDADYIHTTALGRHFRHGDGIEVDGEGNPIETVCGKQIQHDNSGVGHNWRNIDAEDIPASIREEIEGEIIDGGMDECEDFVGSNGLHYRW